MLYGKKKIREPELFLNSLGLHPGIKNMVAEQNVNQSLVQSLVWIILMNYILYELLLSFLS